MTVPGGRYAVYFAPPADTALWRAGGRWLGRDPERSADGAEPVPPVELAAAGISAEDWRAATAEPRRYGFHATLKPPFRLAEGADLSDLDDALAKFAAGRRVLDGPFLRVSRLSGFLALCPPQPDGGLNDLAADCVRAFDRFRRPAETAELDRRRAGGLSARQEQLLTAWGYPYVMEEFRFHLTLTGRLSDADAGRFRSVLEELLAEALSEPLGVEGVALYREPEPGAPFEIVRRYLFAAG